MAAYEASAFMTFPCKFCPTVWEVRKGKTWWMFPPAATSQAEAEWREYTWGFFSYPCPYGCKIHFDTYYIIWISSLLSSSVLMQLPDPPAVRVAAAFSSLSGV